MIYTLYKSNKCRLFIPKLSTLKIVENSLFLVLKNLNIYNLSTFNLLILKKLFLYRSFLVLS